jgi:7-carboxy-7-deazaguanine synthase
MKLARLPDGTPEIFHSLQGEGLSLGRPSIFIRASLCNLHCVWCDTDYTWNWEGTPWRHERDCEPGYAKFRKAEQIIELAPTEVAALVREFPCRHLVLTGGEPLLQEEEFLEVLTILRASDPGWTAEIETNGTCEPGGAFDAAITQYNVSPKLANSRQEEKLRLHDGPLAFFAHSPKASFKFVITNETDLAEVADLRSRLDLAPGHIILMPEGRDPETLAERSRWLAEICRDHGYRFSPRLHIELWGPARAR